MMVVYVHLATLGSTKPVFCQKIVNVRLIMEDIMEKEEKFCLEIVVDFGELTV